ncbi:NADH-quinone oxidoreductase subunit NuoK [Helicobacter apodemus]|uniref:NADH-quinone oxidoreductase subunit K n=1 Tax=Helicobacter apodemus TaxID=135569 RepID=A0A099UEP8_9HELI|nr:NADH-quinone oxidoreductase subunit NuoK [Helicobacter apodemus]AWI33757.1 NADH-quinone oxidoreductase subunit K [Helicobacter apodemus]TLE14884.1 NADH-quinone oxidoreductase subunit NuoK [Helicobacter apodemus]
MITLNHYLIVSALMFMIGIFGILRRKNILMLFFATEILLSSVNVGLVAVGYYLGDLNGQLFAFFILAVAASEVAVGVGLLIGWYKKYHTLDLDSLQIMKG